MTKDFRSGFRSWADRMAIGQCSRSRKLFRIGAIGTHASQLRSPTT